MLLYNKSLIQDHSKVQGVPEKSLQKNVCVICRFCLGRHKSQAGGRLHPEALEIANFSGLGVQLPSSACDL